MKLKTDRIIRILLIELMFLILTFQPAAAGVIKIDNKIFLVDQTGEHWDISQAVSLEFDPKKFEFGIGRNAFDPLDESDWQSGSEKTQADMRVIGVATGDNAHAYSVHKLRYHETANTTLDSKAIVAAY